MADADDAAVLHADIRFDDTEDGIEDEGVGDDEVERLGVGGGGRLAHAVADDLAAAELDLVAVAAALGDEVALDLDEQIGVGKPHLITDGGTEHLGVLAAGKFEAHERERDFFTAGFAGFSGRGECRAGR